MYFDFKGGIISVARVILKRQGVYSSTYNLAKHIYDTYVADSFGFTQLIYHNIVTVLNNLLFKEFRGGAKFYTRWRTLKYDLNIIPRRIFFQIYDEYSDMIEFAAYEPRQFVIATDILYGMIQDFLQEQSITSSYNVFTGLVYESDKDLTSTINAFLSAVNFIDIIESVPTKQDIKNQRRSKHTSWLKSTRNTVARHKTSESIKMETDTLRNQDRVSRAVNKSVLQYAQVLLKLDQQLYDILKQWNKDTRGFLKTKLKKQHKKTRNQVIDLVTAELDLDSKTHRTQKWQSIIKASYEDLQSYELLQELDQYLQEL